MINTTNNLVYGSVIKKMNTRDKEIDDRIGFARDTFSQHSKLTQNENTLLEIRVMVLSSLVRRRRSYDCHAWHQNFRNICKQSAV